MYAAFLRFSLYQAHFSCPAIKRFGGKIDFGDFDRLFGLFFVSLRDFTLKAEADGSKKQSF